MPLTDTEKKTLLLIARTAIESYVQDKRVPGIEVKDPGLLDERGAFVSLHKSGQLRGCIGTFSPDGPLYKTVVEMSVSAAAKDPRFNPVTPYELNDIEIEISALTPLREIKEIRELEVGRHGIYVIKGISRGVLLPQVAIEQGYGREEFLSATCMKAGLNPGCWREGAKIFVFEAEIFREEG